MLRTHGGDILKHATNLYNVGIASSMSTFVGLKIKQIKEYVYSLFSLSSFNTSELDSAMETLTNLLLKTKSAS